MKLKASVFMSAALLVAVPLSASLPANAQASSAEVRAAYVAEIEAWHAARVERLQAPEGWLSLVGLHWLEVGTQRVGSAVGNEVILRVGPAHLGTLSVIDGAVELALADGVEAQIGDDPTVRRAALASDASGAPSVVRFGPASLVLIERDGRFALRVRNPNAPTRSGFIGIERYAVDPTWRFVARFEAHPAGRTIEIASVINTLEAMANPGRLLFERDGKAYSLEAIDDGSGQLFLIFADRTNAKETYGPGRFVYVELPADGQTVLDFNRAYNPPCAFNAYSTCPLPPPENRLDLAVRAGEKRYLGAHQGAVD